jgi:hypothetical protein
VLCFFLTHWQARWGYFLAVVFCLTIPAQIAFVRQNWLAWSIVGVALLPLLQFWDGVFWPNEERSVERVEKRREAAQWRAAVSSLGGRAKAPVLAPWWLSPATAYWSGQPTIAGSSHESLPGILESARFFLANAPSDAREILRRHRVKWVLVSNGEREIENSAALLGVLVPANALGLTLDRFPSQVPVFLILFWQSGTCKVYQVRD